jgi:hypothetical protein
MTKIIAPWSAEQVKALNEWQRRGNLHPFTCGTEQCGGVLTAGADGWTCPNGCGYAQDWAHDFMAEALKCEVCGGQSGGDFVGVASIPGAPMSIAWCNRCIGRDAIPEFIARHDFIFVAGGDLSRLAEWARERTVWADGRYMPFAEFVRRITREEVENAIAEYEAALGSTGNAAEECVCRTVSCGHVASEHGPGGRCNICDKECWM